MAKGNHRAPGKGHSKWLIMMVVVGMFVAIAAPAGASASKTDVCHYDADSGLYHKINISDNAFDKHVAHGDGVPGESFLDETGSGWEFLDDCTLDHVYWLNYGYWDLLPQTVYDLGGVYQNQHVLNAIDQGYAGTLEFTEWATPELVEYWFDFTKLAPETTYQVWLYDHDNGGPFELLGTFTTDEFGVGEFDYGPLNFAPGTVLNYSFWVNEDGWTVMKTDPAQDPPLSYTTH